MDPVLRPSCSTAPPALILNTRVLPDRLVTPQPARCTLLNEAKTQQNAMEGRSTSRRTRSSLTSSKALAARAELEIAKANRLFVQRENELREARAKMESAERALAAEKEVAIKKAASKAFEQYAPISDLESSLSVDQTPVDATLPLLQPAAAKPATPKATTPKPADGAKPATPKPAGGAKPATPKAATPKPTAFKQYAPISDLESSLSVDQTPAAPMQRTMDYVTELPTPGNLQPSAALQQIQPAGLQPKQPPVSTPYQHTKAENFSDSAEGPKSNQSGQRSYVRDKSLPESQGYPEPYHMCSRCGSSTHRDAEYKLLCSECGSKDHNAFLHPGQVLQSHPVRAMPSHGGESDHAVDHCGAPLSVDTLVQASNDVFGVAQGDAYAWEISCLTEPKELPKSSILRKLDPFVNKQGCLRVGGRTHRTELHTQPLISSGKFHMAVLRIRHHHERVHHRGHHFTEGAVRSASLWIVGGGKRISGMIYHCAICRKLCGPMPIQGMADLPKDRLPFKHHSYTCARHTEHPWIRCARMDLSREPILANVFSLSLLTLSLTNSPSL